MPSREEENLTRQEEDINFTLHSPPVSENMRLLAIGGLLPATLAPTLFDIDTMGQLLTSSSVWLLYRVIYQSISLFLKGFATRNLLALDTWTGIASPFYRLKGLS